MAGREEVPRRHRLIADGGGPGLLPGVALGADPETKAPAPEAADAVMYRCLDMGLNFKTTLGNVLTLTPPLIIARGDMDRALDILERAITEVEGGP